MIPVSPDITTVAGKPDASVATIDFNTTLRSALNTGFIDKNSYSAGSHIPRLLTNDKRARVLTELRNELQKCRSFTFSVALISSEMLLTLKQDFFDFCERDETEVSYIVTSTMNLFNTPHAFEELLQLQHRSGGKIKVLVFGGNPDVSHETVPHYHPKGYCFAHTDYMSAIVGSSNLTNEALQSNYEWNIRFSSMNDGQIVADIARAIDRQISDPATIELCPAFIERYRQLYEQGNPEKLETLKRQIQEHQGYTPNRMQIEALDALHATRILDRHRALVVSATGTGKTILCAFDVRRFIETVRADQNRTPKILFVAHRNLILGQARARFQEILGDSVICADYVSGGSAVEADCLFATNLVMSRHRTDFDRDHFDYIIVDESHRSAAATYRDIIDYFEPRFLLGLTATPERADDAAAVFDLFENNVVYEIRLQQALEEKLVCPFHYYGIADLDQIEDLKRGGNLDAYVSDERVEHLVDTLARYKHANTPTRALMFCSRVDEAEALAIAFNQRGFASAFLCGNHSETEREMTIKRLERGEIEYIFTVDIFNEGIDIPCLNLVAMLRNTESSIIFIQQLGRGLRIAEGKDSVVIIDFIGNYANSYLIPLALYGNKGVSKDVLRKRVFDGEHESTLGFSSISFEKIAAERVFAAIDTATLNGKREIRKDCQRLQAMLGRNPMLRDFYEHEAIDPRIILSHKDFNSLPDLWKYALGTDTELMPAAKSLLDFIGNTFIKGKSYFELFALNELVTNYRLTRERFSAEYLQYCASHDPKYPFPDQNRLWDALHNILSGRFYRDDNAVCLVEDAHCDSMNTASTFRLAVQNPMMHRLVRDVIDCALVINRAEYEGSADFVFGRYYSYSDVWRMLCFAREDVWLNVGGYKTVDEITPVFIKYHKDDRTAAVRKYEDGFISPELMVAESKSRRTLDSAEVQAYRDSSRLPVFMRKSDDEKDWMFIGDVDVIDARNATVVDDDGADTAVVEFLLRFREPVELPTYNYFTDNGTNTVSW
ncbi:MAG: DUF3427 domain-containing protein [Actinomycetes bacterium]|jgi:superfamily II DNA or RNA helicase/HKD family nuclease|nr:DUF3427 domain-containing protein [Actinomycetes bacterium]